MLLGLTSYAEEIIGDNQCGFRRNSSTTDRISSFRQIFEEKKWEYSKAVHNLFVNFKKSYHSGKREVFYNILILFGMCMKLVRLLKMCLNEMCSTVRVGRHLCDMFLIKNSIKQGDALSLLLLNFKEYNVGGVQVNQDGLKLIGTHQILVYVNDVNMWGGSVHTEKNTEALVVARSLDWK